MIEGRACRSDAVRRKMGKRMRILVVEDIPRIAAFIRQGLEKSGYGVALAGDGEEGFLDAPFDLPLIHTVRGLGYTPREAP